jgi:hypothetical protein
VPLSGRDLPGSADGNEQVALDVQVGWGSHLVELHLNLQVARLTGELALIFQYATTTGTFFHTGWLILQVTTIRTTHQSGHRITLSNNQHFDSLLTCKHSTRSSNVFPIGRQRIEGRILQQEVGTLKQAWIQEFVSHDRVNRSQKLNNLV